MSNTEPSAPQGDWRDRALSDPEMILDDRDLMRALASANDRQMGGNIVDMRGIAMDRLQTRLDRLEDTHRSVIAAAYENLAGTNQVHRAITRMLEAADLAEFLGLLGTDVAAILRVDRIRLVLESADVTAGGGGGGGGGAPHVQKLEDVLTMVAPGFIDAYVNHGRDVPQRPVTLRQIGAEAVLVYGEAGEWIQSEACLRLDLGDGRLPGLLVMGAEDPHLFRPSHGTDLLAFFAAVFERLMRGWLD